MKRLLLAAALAVGLAIPAAASAVPISVPKIVVNNGYELYVVGRIWSPPSASSCVALLRVQVQVPNGYGGWRVVRALGRHRIGVCEGESGNYSYGDWFAQWRAMYLLRTQPARICAQAVQFVNGTPSRHVSCKRFLMRGGS
jgi:opacity protein-like surface antigen